METGEVRKCCSEAPPGLIEERRTPFSREPVLISKDEYIRLKWEANYWKALHTTTKQQVEALREKVEVLKGRIRDLQKRLFGKTRDARPARYKSHSPVTPKTKRRRGQQPGHPGHGRTVRPYLEEVVETCELTPAEARCTDCGRPFAPFDGTEDSQILEVFVHAHVRRIRRKRYRKTCECSGTPGIITAPPEPRVIPKSGLGVSVWVWLLLGKFLYGRSMHRLCTELARMGAPLASGTISGGLARMEPLFAPVMQALLAKQQDEPLVHADETRWLVFQLVADKQNHLWWLWIVRSRSVLYYRIESSRASTVLLGYFAGLEGRHTRVIVVCDCYSAYRKLARTFSFLVLAFCWAHIRRRFLKGAYQHTELQPWMLEWVEKIEKLYRLNRARLVVWEKDKALSKQSPEFARRQQKLTDALSAMAQDRDRQLQPGDLRPSQQQVLKSIQTHWEGLTVFRDHPQVPMDNNAAENGLRGPALGRKNFYGSGSARLARLTAALFSMLQTIIHWGLNPHRWLSEYLTACAENGGRPPENLAPFLPWEMAPERRELLARPVDMKATERPALIDDT